MNARVRYSQFVLFCGMLFVLIFMGVDDGYAKESSFKDGMAIDEKKVFQPDKGNKKSVNVADIVNAHQKALKTYKEKKYGKAYAALKIMKNSAVEDILWEKPYEISNEEYVAILNDYAFFLIEHYDSTCGADLSFTVDKSIKILRHVIKNFPDRAVAYLNLGDALYEKMKIVYNFLEKKQLAAQISKYYRRYKIIAKKDLQRVDQFLSSNISYEQPDNICDYILKHANNGTFFQIISRPKDISTSTIQECDIDNDGDLELIRFYITGSLGYRSINIKKLNSENWLTLKDAYNMSTTFYPAEDSEVEYQAPPYSIAIIPFSDGNYIVFYNNSGPYIAEVRKLEPKNSEFICSFNFKNKKSLSICRNNEICKLVMKSNEFNYIKYTEKFSLAGKRIKLFDTDSINAIFGKKAALIDIDNDNEKEFIAPLRFYWKNSSGGSRVYITHLNNSTDALAETWINDALLLEIGDIKSRKGHSVIYRPFKFINKIYIEVKSLKPDTYPFYEIWELNKGKRNTICSLRYVPIHQVKTLTIQIGE